MATPIIAVLGLGSIGRRHAANAAALGATVIGWDPDPTRGSVADRAHAIASADGVVIASPSGQHARDLADVVAAGKHVLVEKPIALHPADILGALDMAERDNRVVYAAFNLRLHAAVKAAKALLTERRFGDPIWARAIAASYLPSWRPGQDHRNGYAADPRSGGIIYDDIHELDLMQHLLGPASVAAAHARATGRIGIASDDVADILLRHDGGVGSSIHMDYLTRPAMRFTEIGCVEGTIRIDLIARRIEATRADGTSVMDQTLPGDFAADYVAEMALFLGCIDGTATPACTGREAAASLALACDARRISGLPTP